jgi:hypothetical protein
MTSPQTLAAAPPFEKQRAYFMPLIPSLSDLYFLALMVWLFLCGQYGWKGLLADADVGWHIRTGEYILDHHAVPRTDLYSFSKPGAPWFAWEWLSDVIDAAVFRAGGLKGVVLLAGVMIVLFATILLRRMIWRGAHLLVAVIVSLLGVGSASIHYLARPHVFTLVLLSIAMWMIEADLGKPSRWIWLLVPLTVLWTNLHGGFLALIAVLGLTAAVEVVTKRQWRYASLTSACAAASLINPYGIHLHQHALEYLRSDWIRKVVQEFQSPSFRNENMMQFEVLLVAGLIAVGLLFRKRKIAEGVWILFFAYEALGSVRHVPVFVIVAAPLIAEEVGVWWREWTARAGKASPAGIVNQISFDFEPGFRRTSVWPALAILALVFMGRPIAWPKDFPEEIFPVAMIHAHESEIFSQRVLTTDQWADYLIYLNPQYKVFVDGRSDFYGPEIGDTFLHLVSGQPEWRQVMQKYDFGMVLLPQETALVQLLRTQPDWRVADQDPKHILLVRKATSVPATWNLTP